MGFNALHAYFLDRLVPVCAQLLAAAAQAGEISADNDVLELMRGIDNLCIQEITVFVDLPVVAGRKFRSQCVLEQVRDAMQRHQEDLTLSGHNCTLS